MKKLILVFLLLLGFGTAEAAAPSQQDIEQVMGAIKNVRYHTEAGINFSTYREVVIKAGVEQRRFTEKYPDSDLVETLKRIMLAYNDAGTIWKDAIYNYGKTIKTHDPTGQYLLRAYPSFSNLPARDIRNAKTKAVMWREWWYEDVMAELWRVAHEYEKNMDKPAQ